VLIVDGMDFSEAVRAPRLLTGGRGAQARVVPVVRGGKASAVGFPVLPEKPTVALKRLETPVLMLRARCAGWCAGIGALRWRTSMTIIGAPANAGRLKGRGRTAGTGVLGLRCWAAGMDVQTSPRTFCEISAGRMGLGQQAIVADMRWKPPGQHVQQEAGAWNSGARPRVMVL